MNISLRLSKYNELKQIENELRDEQTKKQVRQVIQEIKKHIRIINNSKKKNIESTKEVNTVIETLIDFYNQTEDQETYSKLRKVFFKLIEPPKTELMT